MAMTDLVIWPRTKTLKYASKMFDELRLIFADIQERKDVSQAVYEIAARGKGRCISAKATVDDGIDDAVTLAVAASAIPSRRADDAEGGSAGTEGSAVAATSGETPLSGLVTGEGQGADSRKRQVEFLLSCIDMCNEAGAPPDEMDAEDVAEIDAIRATLAAQPEIKS
jgi:hypothetical protein